MAVRIRICAPAPEHARPQPAALLAPAGGGRGSSREPARQGDPDGRGVVGVHRGRVASSTRRTRLSPVRQASGCGRCAAPSAHGDAGAAAADLTAGAQAVTRGQARRSPGGADEQRLRADIPSPGRDGDRTAGAVTTGNCGDLTHSCRGGRHRLPLWPWKGWKKIITSAGRRWGVGPSCSGSGA